MMDPRISLAAAQGVPKVSQAISIYENALMNAKNREIATNQDARASTAADLNNQVTQNTIDTLPTRNKLLEQSAVAGQMQIDNARDDKRLRNLAEAAIQLAPVLEQDLAAGDTTKTQAALTRRLSALEAAKVNDPDLDNTETMESLAMLKEDPQALLDNMRGIVNIAKSRGIFGGNSTAVRSNAPITNQKTGQVSFPTFNPNTQQAELVDVPGAFQETQAQKNEREISFASKKKRAELKEGRASTIKAELGERNRSAARAQRPIMQALKLASKATQGVSGATKLQLSRLLPGVDASDEGALDSVLKQLSLEQLQKFKGPTTDFEYGVTEAITGSLGQSKEANIARVKSLQRNNWFNQREFDQFNKHIKSGGDADSFSFNFGEPVKTKKGVFTLQDIQDTAVDNNLTIEETIKRLNE